MNEFKVVDIVDANVIKTLPSWHWVNRDGKPMEGDTVIISGLVLTNEAAKTAAKERLKGFLIDQYVTLQNPKEVTDKTAGAYIECTVLLNGVNISTYFPEFKATSPKP